MTYANGTYSKQIDVSKNLAKLINRQKKYIFDFGDKYTIIYMVKKVNPYVLSYDMLTSLPKKICQYIDVHSFFNGSFINHCSFGLVVNCDEIVTINYMYEIWEKIYSIISKLTINNKKLALKLLTFYPETQLICTDRFFKKTVNIFSFDNKKHLLKDIMAKYCKKNLFGINVNKSFDEIINDVLNDIKKINLHCD